MENDPFYPFLSGALVTRQRLTCGRDNQEKTVCSCRLAVQISYSLSRAVLTNVFIQL